MKFRGKVKLVLIALCALPMLAAAQVCPLGKGPGPGPGPALGARGGPGPGMGGGPHALGQFMRSNWWEAPKVQEELELTPEQIDALKNASLEVRKQEIELRATQEKVQLELEQLLQSDTIDDAKAAEVAKNLGTVAGKRVELQTTQRLFVAKTLTPEQRAKAKELVATRMREEWKKRTAAEMRERPRARAEDDRTPAERKRAMMRGE